MYTSRAGRLTGRARPTHDRIRGTPCSTPCSWPTAARSPSASCAPRATSASRRWPCTPTRTPQPRTCGSRTSRCASAPRAASESYLRPELVLHAASETGAGAIHPGYGFLSENAQFAREVEAAGIAFVGPTAAHLSVFGDKHQAREAAQAAGVPLVAGSGLLESVDEALAAASVVGYPVMVKAVGGGGGHRHAGVCRRRRAGGRVRPRAAPRGGELRQRRGVPGAVRVPRAAPRGAGVRRRRRSRGEPGGPRLLAAAAQPEGGRGGPGARASRRGPRDAPRVRPGAHRVGVLPVRGHRRVRLRRRPRRGVVPRGQHPPAGRAPGDRGGDPRRPGRVDAAAGAGRLVVPRRGPRRGSRHRGARRRGPRVRRGPPQGLPAERRACSPRSSTPRTRPSGSTPGPRPGSR